VRPWVPRYDFAASLLRPWRLCCVLGRSKDAVRSRGMCEGSLTSGVAWHTPVRTCLRWKAEIQKLEKAKKLKNAIKLFVK